MLPVVRVVPLRTVNERSPARYYLSPWKIKLKETQEIAGKKTEETSQTAAARAQGKIPRASVPSKPQTAPQAL
jgi:hypothetical protein